MKLDFIRADKAGTIISNDELTVKVSSKNDDSVFFTLKLKKLDNKNAVIHLKQS